ncbi:hypothetical protein CHCC5026_3342 [Bacillus licheniformis]|nr:hypothetical protein CHCC5026_3342 [Bacillus licheniformis]
MYTPRRTPPKPIYQIEVKFFEKIKNVRSVFRVKEKPH